MTALPITQATAGTLALAYVVLSARVIAARGRAGASLGDGSGGIIPPGQEHTVPLLVACRAHANFAEYVPIALILLALNEATRGSHFFVAGLAIALVVGRVMHPVGMGRKVPNPFRLGAMMLTFGMIGVSALSLLLGVIL